MGMSKPSSGEKNLPLRVEGTFLALPTSGEGQAFGNEFMIALFLCVSVMLWQ